MHTFSCCIFSFSFALALRFARPPRWPLFASCTTDVFRRTMEYQWCHTPTRSFIDAYLTCFCVLMYVLIASRLLFSLFPAIMIIGAKDGQVSPTADLTRRYRLDWWGHIATSCTERRDWFNWFADAPAIMEQSVLEEMTDTVSPVKTERHPVSPPTDAERLQGTRAIFQG